MAVKDPDVNEPDVTHVQSEGYQTPRVKSGPSAKVPLEADAPTVLVMLSRQSTCDNLAVRMFARTIGLSPSEEGCRLEFHQGTARVTRGPFPATEELLAGYTVIETDSLEQAIEWAKQTLGTNQP